MAEREQTPAVRWEITWGSIFRILAGILLAYLAVLLWPMAELLLLGILIAVTLYPIVSWTCRNDRPRWMGVLMGSLILLVLAALLFGLIGPLLFTETAKLADNLPKLQDEMARML